MSTTLDERVQRIHAAVSLQDIGSVPLVPQLCRAAALRFQGLTQAAGNDLKVALEAMVKTFDDYGGWDGLYTEVPDTPDMQIMSWMQPMRFLVPGIDIEEDRIMQVDEREILLPNDYGKISELGWSEFYFGEYLARICNYTLEEIPRVAEGLGKEAEECVKEWRRHDVAPLYFAGRIHPFFFLSLARSMVRFTEDLYYRNDEVERTLAVMMDEWIDEVRQAGDVLEGPTKYVFVAEERAQEYSPAIFERMWWKDTRRMVEAFHEAGFVTWLHLDGVWDRKLEYFRELPRASFVLQLDSMTDIRLAKRVLGGHCALHGDVPPALQVLGTPEEVSAYCMDLMRDVGRGGGFVLGTGCEVAPDCTRENFQAIVEAARVSR